jgi:ribose 5-phosphate isomerase A
MVNDYDPNAVIDIYVDGADEVDRNLNLIKGGGGAHTNEKRLAKISNKFICVVDESKIVKTLGKFPLPIEIDSSNKEKALLELKKYSENITLRDSLSDNKNYIFDIHNFKVTDPQKTEKDMLEINGVIDVGIFSANKPQTVIVGDDSSYRLIES